MEIRRMRSARWAVVAAICLAPAAPVASHHSFAMFDKSKETWLEGTVTEFQWTNPHAFIQVAVPGRAKAVEWSLEGGSPNILSRNGWKRTSLRKGEKVRVLVYPLRSGKPGGSFLEVHKQDGTVYYYHG
ncbi:DUF6152 family protein [Tsuneonella sp. HG222]